MPTPPISPTPWHVESSGGTLCQIRDANGGPVAGCLGIDDAEHIVRVVNAAAHRDVFVYDGDLNELVEVIRAADDLTMVPFQTGAIVPLQMGLPCDFPGSAENPPPQDGLLGPPACAECNDSGTMALPIADDPPGTPQVDFEAQCPFCHKTLTPAQQDLIRNNMDD